MSKVVEATVIDPVNLVSRIEFGGKAAGLLRLKSLCLSVPDSWAFPCWASIKRPNISLGNIDRYSSRVKYAVRSGAPISMPGMLHTSLNVPYDALKHAIAAVWDSWDSEEAKAYREAHGIPDAIGTGVIVQRMIEPIESGVMFTSDPQTSSTDFMPIVEWVEGCGDALVGGKAVNGHLRGIGELETKWSGLVKRGHRIHTAFGPSDVEWVLGEGDNLYFVQHRELQLLKVEPPPLSASEGDVLCSAQSIGDPTSVTGIVTLVTETNVDVLYVGDFAPQYYPKMLQARAILCVHGGFTCHAAILGRELRKPVLSGIPLDKGLPWVHTCQLVTVDGVSGCVRKALEVTTEGATVEVVSTGPKRQPDLSLAKKGYWNVNKLLHRFYYTLEMMRLGRMDITVGQQRIKEIADILCCYFYMACNAEMRHSHTRAHKVWFQIHKPLLELGISLSQYTGGFGREQYLRVHVPPPATAEQAIAVVACLYQGYMMPEWPPSTNYGGKKWGAITKLLLDYLEGNLTDTLFVDASFNLQHNGGQAFGKFNWLSSISELLMNQLNAKAMTWECLDAVIPLSWKEEYREYVEAPELLTVYCAFESDNDDVDNSDNDNNETPPVASHGGDYDAAKGCCIGNFCPDCVEEAEAAIE